MARLVAILIGGGAGSVGRYLLAGLVQPMSRGLFPLGTLAVNTLGCLLIGLLGAYFAGPQLVREEVRVGLLIGLLGGFTTFSTFAWESIALANDGQFARAAANVVLTNATCLCGAWLGYRLGERLFGA